MKLQLPKVIGHRGAKAYAPENSFAGLREAKARGADWVEIDVMLSRDGVALLHHDHDLKRTAGLRKKVAAADWSEIEGLDAGSWFSPDFAGVRVPRLDRAIGLMAELGLGCNFEMKPTRLREVRTAEAALAVIQELWPASLPVPLISSFKVKSLHAAQRAAPALPRGYLVERLPKRWRATAERLECSSVHPEGKHLSAGQVKEIKAAGFLVAAYTVNEPDLAKRIMDWGADAIITDVPDVIAAALA